jgi:hypothetical protein
LPGKQGDGHSGLGESSRQRRAIAFANADYGTYRFTHFQLSNRHTRPREHRALPQPGEEGLIRQRQHPANLTMLPSLLE